MSFLSDYVRERTENVDHLFSVLNGVHAEASAALASRLATMSPAEAERLIDTETVLLSDGTRRSPDAAFDGYVTREGRQVFGMGLFFSHGADIPADEKAVLAAAYPIVATVGPAAHTQYDNFYFFTPHNRLVMFGPDRPDHLLFYRKTAPATLDYASTEMAKLAKGPAGATRCTSLQRLIQDHEHGAQQIGTACVTPVYVAGRLLGAFGSTIRLDRFLGRVVAEKLPGADTLIVRRDGELIAASNATLSVTRDEAAVARYERSLGLKRLAARLWASHQSFGVTRSADGSTIIAYGRMDGPGWLLLLSYPASAVAWSAARSASWLLMLGLLGAALQTLAFLQLARVVMVRPLKMLIRSCDTQDSAALAVLERRTDEIGILAGSLSGERARSEDLLNSLERRVEERTAELERANTEKSLFLANMSHELRTPLNGVIALAETLAHEQTTPRNAELAALIVDSGRLLEQVLSDILDFSKIEAGEMRIEIRSFDLATMVSRVSELHRASADAKGVALLWSVSDQAAGTYLGDAVRLTQILSNLLSNAVKFTMAGEIVVRVALDDGRLRFAVRDSGIGFDEEARERLFQRFEQADVSIRRRFGGTGLGLAICRSLVELMGGDIQASSRPGHGSEFSFSLPLERASRALDDEARAEPAATLGLAGIRVLLAEDHPTNQKVISLIMESVGAELTTVENGRLAVDAFLGGDFDIVLMDMQMPELDGLAATAEIRELEAARERPRTPLIMLTANAHDEHRRASLAAGADQHISKPIHARALVEAMVQCLLDAADRPIAA